MTIAQALKAYYNHYEDVERLLDSANAFDHTLEQIDDFIIVYTFDDDSRLRVETIPMGDFVEVIE